MESLPGLDGRPRALRSSAKIEGKRGMAGGSILAIDQGTTSTRAIIFDLEGGIRATAQHELPQIFPDDGWVEHDPEEIWRATVGVCREVLAKDGEAAGIGITNQRQT